MKTAVIRHILKRESRADLFRLYPKSLFLSGLFLLLCAGSSSLYAFLSETTIAYLPPETGGAVRELCFFGMILLFSPFFGGVLAHFGRLARKNENGGALFSDSVSARRNMRLAGVLLYALAGLFRFGSFALALWKSSVPEDGGTPSSLTGALISIFFGLGALFLFLIAAYFAICTVCILFSERLGEESFFPLLFKVLRDLAPLSGLLCRSAVSALPLGILSYFSYGVFFFLFALPYALFYLCRLSLYADCRRFGFPLREKNLPTKARYEQ